MMTSSSSDELLHDSTSAFPTGIGLAVTPAGHLVLREDVAPESADEARAWRRIEPNLRLGVPRGLLLLGAEEVATVLPPVLAFWRDFARLYLQRLCSTPDLETLRGQVSLEPPRTELEGLSCRVPPMQGAEYLHLDTLLELWKGLEQAFREEISGFDGPVQDWLRQRHPTWNSLGRVYFHLVENRSTPQTPFAFMATYAGRLSFQAKVQHLPLSRALKEYSGAADRDNLLKLLVPVQRAMEQSGWLRNLVDRGEIYHPLALSAAEAYQVLKDVPIFEAAGILMRLPDWWTPRRPARPQVRVEVGGNPPGGVGLAAMLDFKISYALEDDPLTPEEWDLLMSSVGDLVPLRGRWVEVDRAKLNAALVHWRSLQQQVGSDGISFLEGLRLLAGAPLEGLGDQTGESAAPGWSRVSAGPWLESTLEALRDPARLGDISPGAELKTQLRPYQQEGLRWLWKVSRLGLGACLADDMGLGKTLQVLALLLVSRRHGEAGPSLLVVPASLIANWQAEIERFVPCLQYRILHSSAAPDRALVVPSSEAKTEDGPRSEPVPGALLQQDRSSTDLLRTVELVITTYGTVSRLEWLRSQPWSMVILDEAQAIKNPGTQQARAIKKLQARSRLALTGTPIENRLSDLWSLFDFLQPGLLGTAKGFGQLVKRLEKDQARGYAPLRALVGPYVLRRLKTDRRIIADLPDKTELQAFCPLTPAQAALYQQAVTELKSALERLEGIQRRGVVLAFLMRFKQICNHPSHWLGDGIWSEHESGKFCRLRELTEEISSRQEKVLVFTQFQEMTTPLSQFLSGVFKKPGLVLHGDTPVRARRECVEAFQREEGPPHFVLSLKAGGTGLTLTAASHVIHFDRWWNPAVENQATDRAFRIGQKRNVLVHKFICQGTIEEKIDALIASKQGLSKELLETGGELNLTELSNEALLKLVSLDLSAIGPES